MADKDQITGCGIVLLFFGCLGAFPLFIDSAFMGGGQIKTVAILILALLCLVLLAYLFIFTTWRAYLILTLGFGGLGAIFGVYETHSIWERVTGFIMLGLAGLLYLVKTNER
jgi:hypothetical protein